MNIESFIKLKALVLTQAKLSSPPSPLHFCAGNIINFMLAENEGLIFLWIKHLDQTRIFCKSLLAPKKRVHFFGSVMQKRFSEYVVISGFHDMAKEKNRRPLREESCVKFIAR